MKTIRQLADEIGVSKQAVQKRLVREPLYTQIQSYIHTKEGTKYIDDVGENLIKSAFGERVYTKVVDNEHIDNESHVHTLIVMLQEQLQVKDRQITDLQQSNRELTAALENTTASLHAAQALHAGTMHKQLVGASPEETAAVEITAEQPGPATAAPPPGTEPEQDRPRRSWWPFGKKK